MMTNRRPHLRHRAILNSRRLRILSMHRSVGTVLLRHSMERLLNTEFHKELGGVDF